MIMWWPVGVFLSFSRTLGLLDMGDLNMALFEVRSLIDCKCWHRSGENFRWWRMVWGLFGCKEFFEISFPSRMRLGSNLFEIFEVEIVLKISPREKCHNSRRIFPGSAEVYAVMNSSPRGFVPFIYIWDDFAGEKFSYPGWNTKAGQEAAMRAASGIFRLN